MSRNTIVHGTLLLLGLLLLLLWRSIFTGQALLATDLIFKIDPLWRPLAPEGFTAPGNHALSDQVFFYYPWKHFILQSLEQGRLPLWNPHINGGQPFLGDGQSGIFEPFNLVAYLFPLPYTFVVVAFLRLFVAGFFTLLFAREIGITKSGSFLAMIAFTFSGVEIATLSYPTASVIAWLPAILFFSERVIKQDSWRPASLLALVIGFQFLVGHPATSFHVLLVAGPYCLYRLACLYGRQIRPQLIRGLKLTIASLMGLLLGAAQLLPFIETLLVSDAFATRGAPPTLAGIFFPWRSWLAGITAVLPDYFGNPVYDNYWYPGPVNYIELTVYAGIIPLALLITVVLLWLSRRYDFHDQPETGSIIRFFLVLAVVSLGLALRWPLFNLLNQLPVLDMAKNDRLRVIYVFATAVVAGFGLDLLNRSRYSLPRAATAVGRLFTFTLGIIALTTLLFIGASAIGLVLFREPIIQLGQAQAAVTQDNPFFYEPPDYYLHLVEVRYRQMLANFHPRNLRMYLPVLIAAIYIALRHLAANRARRIGFVTASVLLLTVIDLLAINYAFNPTIPVDQIYPTPEIIRFLQQDDQSVFRIIGLDLALSPNSAVLFNLHDVRGYEPVSAKRYMDLIAGLEGHARIVNISLFTQANSPLLDLLNVKYAISPQPLDERWQPVYTDSGRMTLYRNRQVVPRAFLVHEAVHAAGPEQSLAWVLDPAFDFRQQVVLEGANTNDDLPQPHENMQMQKGLLDTRVSQPDTVQITKYRPEQVEIEVFTQTGGFLVLSDTHMPGWYAYIDDVPTEIWPANHAFRAIAIPPGQHQISFRYTPLSFKVGTLLSLATALVIGLSLLNPGKYWRRTSGH